MFSSYDLVRMTIQAGSICELSCPEFSVFFACPDAPDPVFAHVAQPFEGTGEQAATRPDVAVPEHCHIEIWKGARVRRLRFWRVVVEVFAQVGVKLHVFDEAADFGCQAVSLGFWEVSVNEGCFFNVHELLHPLQVL